jgi:TP901 family phage tail tape measure protein
LAGTLGTVYGQVQIDVKQAVTAYAALRAANASTLYALRGGSTAFLAAGAAIGGVGLLIGAGFAKAIKAAATFERQLDFFGAVSNSTAAEMEAVRAKALQLGKDTIFSAGQIADSFVELGKAGVSADQIVNGVGDAVANLGAAADIPLDVAANIISAAVQTFQLSAKDAVHVTDLLAGAANASIVEVQDLGVSLKYVGGIAASISIPIEDTITAISLLGKAGIKGSTAGTSLRQILVSLTGSSVKAKKQLKALGIITKDGANQFFTAQGKAKPLSEVFEILRKKTEGLTEAQRLAAFKTIFNNRALAAANILTRDGAKGFADMNKEIGKTTAADVAHKRLDNLSGDVEILRGNIETLAIQAGSPFQNFLRGIVQGLTKLLQVFSNLSPGMQAFIIKALAVTAVLLITMGAVATIIGIVFKFYESMILLKGGLQVVGTTIKVVSKAMRVLTLSLLTNPVFLIIAAIVLLVVAFILLYKHSERFRKIVNAVGAALVVAFKATVEFFKGVPGFFVMVWGKITGAFTAGKNAIVNAWNAVGHFFSALWTTIITALGTFATGFINFWAALPGRILGFVLGMINSIAGFFATLPERVAYWLGFMIGRSIKLVSDWAVATGQRAQNLYTTVVNWIKALPGAIATFFTNIYNGTVSRWNSIRNFVGSAAKAIYSSVINWLKGLPGQIANFFKTSYSNAVNWWNSIRSGVATRAQGVYNAVITWIKGIPGAILGFLRTTYNNFVNQFNSMKTLASGAGSSIKDAVINGVKALPGLLKDVLNRALDTLSGLGTAAFNKAKSIGSSIWSGFKDGMGIHSPSFIEKAMFQITDTMRAELGNMKKNVGSLHSLGATLPNLQDMILATRNAQNERVSAIGSPLASRLAPETNKATVAPAAGTTINLTTINPVGETTVETLSNQATRLGQLGLLPR